VCTQKNNIPPEAVAGQEDADGQDEGEDHGDHGERLLSRLIGTCRGGKVKGSVINTHELFPHDRYDGSSMQNTNQSFSGRMYRDPERHSKRYFYFTTMSWTFVYFTEENPGKTQDTLEG